MPKSYLRPIHFGIIMFATMIFVMFSAAEFVTRFAGGKPAAFIYSGSFRDHQTDYDVTYGVTTEGLRVTCRMRETRVKRKFAIIGDSFAFGQGVPDCNDFVSKLPVLIPDAEFVNFAAIGIGIDEYEMIARDMIGSDFTDVVVLFYGNDVSEVVENKSFFGSLADISSTFALIRKIKRILAVKSFYENASSEEGPFNNIRAVLQQDREYFAKVADPGAANLRLFRTAFFGFINRLKTIVPQEKIWIAVAPEATTVSQQVRQFVSNLGGTLPGFGVPGSGYEEIRTLSRRAGVKFIDLFPRFRETANKLYFPHDLHWSVDGHQVAAEVIAEAFRTSGGRGL